MPDHKVHCEECGGFLNIRGVGSCHCSTEHKPNDEPKISPSAMEAEFTYREYTGVMAAAAQIYREFGIAKTLTHPEIDGKPTIVYIKNIIKRHMHLSAIQAALRELVEVVEDVEAGRCCWVQMGARMASLQTFAKVQAKRRAALAKAKEVLKP